LADRSICGAEHGATIAAAAAAAHIDSFVANRYLWEELEQKEVAMRSFAFHIAAAAEREEDIPAR
jgi:hypothetical protein